MIASRPDSVDLLRVCRPVNTSFSAVALGCTAQCVKESKPVLNAVSRKCETIQRAAFPPSCSWRSQSVKSRLQPLETSVSLQTEARSTLQGRESDGRVHWLFFAHASSCSDTTSL